MKIRAQGAKTTREWLLQNHGDRKTDPRWTDLWTAAAGVDFLLADCKSDQERWDKLSTNDQLELHLRRLSAFMYECRTKDSKGALHMLAQAPPGSQIDIGPDWLITEATTHSKVEHQRDAFVRGGRGASRGGGGGRTPFAAAAADGKPDGRGGGGKRGRARGGR